MKPFLPSSSFLPLRRGAIIACTLLLTPLALLPSSAFAAHDTSGTPRKQIVNAATGPANDNFANAQVLAGNTGTVTGNNVGATKQTGEPDHDGESGGASVWYVWTPTITAQAVISTANSNFDTLLAVYTGTSLTALTPVASNDDYGNLTSQVTFEIHAGTTYHIAIDGFDGDEGVIGLDYHTMAITFPLITSVSTASAQVGSVFSYQITATNSPTSFAAHGLPPGVTVNATTGLVTGTPTTTGQYTAVIEASNANGTGQAGLTVTVTTRPSFFDNEVALGSGAYYLQFATGNPFGYYSYLTDQHYIYHYDMGYEYLFDANDGNQGIYLYDFLSREFYYTSPTFPFPYIYDFNLRSVLYYYPDTNNPGHYTTNPRYFYNFATGKIISK